jgi:hypothetical protein
MSPELAANTFVTFPTLAFSCARVNTLGSWPSGPLRGHVSQTCHSRHCRAFPWITPQTGRNCPANPNMHETCLFDYGCLIQTETLQGVETLGEAFSYGWRVTARCAAGKQDGMHRHKECLYRPEDPQPGLSLSRLDTRLRCPRCGSRELVLLFTVPRSAMTARVSTHS